MDKALTYLFYDLLEGTLLYAENPGKFGEYLTGQLRELIGGRVVMLFQTEPESENNTKYSLLSVCPSKKLPKEQLPELYELLNCSSSFTQTTFLNKENTDARITDLIIKLNIDKCLFIPLYISNHCEGAILIYDLLEDIGTSEVINTLNKLSGVFALILRNTKIFNNLESLVNDRTREIIEKNRELMTKQQLLKNQNEEYLSLNEELNESNLLLKNAKEKAEEGERLKTAFLQNISHEIRTPMNAICGFSDLLNQPNLAPQKITNYTRIIQTSCNQLLSVVNDILTISAIETNQDKINVTKVNINDLLLNLHSVFKPKATEKNISLYTKQALSDEFSFINTDAIKLNQILTNLLNNALKFTHEGFVEFGYEYVETHDHAPVHELQFYVKDTGIGINPEFHDKIFNRFQQANHTIHKIYGGTGLGLAISKAFVELLEGEIWVESVPDQGSVFYFTLPYRPVNKLPDIKKTVNNNLRKTILIAEDEEVNYLYLEEIFLNRNVNIIHAKNGLEAVKCCSENANIDLILMDIKMPFMNGLEATKIIKQLLPDIPVIAQTAYALENEIQNAMNFGFNDYVTKPINKNHIINLIQKYIKID